MKIQTINQLISVFKDVATRHYQINGFGIGDNWEIGASEAKMHPVLWINPVSATMPESENVGYKTFEIDFEVRVFDLVNKDESNENDVLSDTIDILRDIISEFKGHPYYTNSSLTIVNDLDFTPFTEEFDEEVSGWVVEMSMKTPVINSWCGLPMADITGFEFPGADCPNVNVLCPVFVQDIIGEYPIIVTDGGDDTKIISIDQAALTDIYVTGGTYSVDTITLNRNDDQQINITGITTDNFYLTGQTFSGNTLTSKLNNGDVISTNIDNFTGLTVNGDISGTTFYGDGSNLTGIDTSNIYNTDGSLTGNRIVDLSDYALTFNGNALGGITSSFNGRTAFISNRTNGEANILEVQDRLNNRIFEVRQNNSVHINAQGTGDVVLGGDSLIACEKISLQGNTLISDELVQHVSTTPTADGCLINDSLSFHIDDTNTLAGRYKNNLGVVTDLKFPVESGKVSINDSNGKPTYYTDLKGAVDNCVNGDTINIHASHTVDFVNNGLWTWDKSLDIVMNGYDIVIENCGGILANGAYTYNITGGGSISMNDTNINHGVFYVGGGVIFNSDKTVNVFHSTVGSVRGAFQKISTGDAYINGFLTKGNTGFCYKGTGGGNGIIYVNDSLMDDNGVSGNLVYDNGIIVSNSDLYGRVFTTSGDNSFTDRTTVRRFINCNIISTTSYLIGPRSAVFDNCTIRAIGYQINTGIGGKQEYNNCTMECLDYVGYAFSPTNSSEHTINGGSLYSDSSCISTNSTFTLNNVRVIAVNGLGVVSSIQENVDEKITINGGYIETTGGDCVFTNVSTLVGFNPIVINGTTLISNTSGKYCLFARALNYIKYSNLKMKNTATSTDIYSRADIPTDNPQVSTSDAYGNIILD